MTYNLRMAPIPSGFPTERRRIGGYSSAQRPHHSRRDRSGRALARAHGGHQEASGSPHRAVVDAYKGRVERAVERTGAKPYRDYREVLADKSIDTVVVATPDHWHKQMIIEAMRAGKDVYSEKPMTYRSSGRRGDRARRARTGRIVQVGSQGVSSEPQQKAKEMIRAGKIGRVTIIRAAYNRNTASGAWIYPIPPDANPQTVNWEMFLGPAPRRPFSLERFFRWRCYQDYPAASPRTCSCTSAPPSTT